MYSDWFVALVIILSVMLAISLLLLIILLVQVLKIVKAIRHITAQAEQVVDKAESVAEFFKKTSTPMAIIKIIANASDTVKDIKKKVKK